MVVLTHVSLDGVIQSPARPDEDTRGGFAHGGWAAASGDEVMATFIGPVGTGGPGGMLMGRRSYEDMLGHWNQAGGPFKWPGIGQLWRADPAVGACSAPPLGRGIRTRAALMHILARMVGWQRPG